LETNQAFQPIRIRTIEAPSRVFLAPVNTGFGVANAPSPRLTSFHVRRASSAVGLSYIGNVLADRGMAFDTHVLVLDDASDLAQYAKLAAEIRLRGSVPAIQLAALPPELNAERRWQARDRPQEILRLRQIVTSLSSLWLADALERLVHSTALATEAGFQAVQVHAAHGYLLSLLLTPTINLRQDDFGTGGPWLGYLLKECRIRLRDGLLSIRLNAFNGVEEAEREVATVAELAAKAVAHGVDIVDFSAGLYTLDRRLIYPGMTHRGPIYLRYLASLLTIGAPLVTVSGRFTDPVHLVHPALAKHRALLSFGVARALIADPDWALKASRGQSGEIAHCRSTNRCHYFSRGTRALQCGVNPEV
jgi:2,4-dienoyl-CoA reductase-like NADH-dependent reductase (Old Yellow Enzyme family)